MCGNECINTVGCAAQGKVKIEIVLPKNTGKTFVGQDVGIGKQFVIRDRAAFIAQVVILHKSYCTLRLVFQNRITIHQTHQAKSILITHAFE